RNVRRAVALTGGSSAHTTMMKFSYFLLIAFAIVDLGRCFPIVCWIRTGSSDETSNGSGYYCGYSHCHSYTPAGETGNFAACGRCPQGDPTCLECTKDYCNNRTSSTLRCYANKYDVSSSPTSNGVSLACTAGFSSCFSYTKFPADYSSNTTYFGCGTCNQTEDPACVNCGSNLCNTALPTPFRCYYGRYNISGPVSNETSMTCQTGITTCFSAIMNIDTPHYVYGCGNCSADTMPSCAKCSSDLCNTAEMSALTCIHRDSGNNSQSVTCAKGISTCYSLTRSLGTVAGKDIIPLSGCGACTPRTAALYGCTSCSTSDCNGPQSTTTPATTTTSSRAATTTGSNASVRSAPSPSAPFGVAVALLLLSFTSKF
ncbi:hypothetical protein BOX15_Mlig007435g1, partial [Macrostomum lignano]